MHVTPYETYFVMTEVEIHPIVTPIGKVALPPDVSEESDINGFVFSQKLLRAAKLTKLDLPDAVARGKSRFRYASLAKRIASDSDGGSDRQRQLDSNPH